MATEIEREIQQAIEDHDMERLIKSIPYGDVIGIGCTSLDEQFIFTLAKNDDNLGNPTLPAIHGGVMGGFMEMSGSLHVMMFASTVKIPKVVNFSIDYLSPGRHRDSFVKCDLVRQGRKIVNVSMIAWQTEIENPIATARAQFLLA